MPRSIIAAYAPRSQRSPLVHRAYIAFSSIRPSTPSFPAAQSFSTRPKRPPFHHHHHRPPPPPAEPEPPVLELPPHYALHRDEVHCLLGANGSGKSRLLQQLQQVAAQQRSEGTPSGRRVRLGTLSFDAHRAFVREHGHQVVADVLGGIGSPDARDLIVRLGLFPVWDSHIRYLSTGELRKVLLAVTLLKIPRANVLILDQPFDGLDKAARKQLEWMLGQLTKGFTRLLVDTGGRNDAFAYKTQVLLVANRLEQVFPDILTHVVLLHPKKQDDAEENHVTVLPWVDPEQPDQMLSLLKQRLSIGHALGTVDKNEMEDLVSKLFASVPTSEPTDAAVQLRHLSVAYGRRLLLENVDFQRARHQHWALLGPNGSGKSSLMRVLMQSPGHGQVGGDVVVTGDRLAVVSTDQHLEMLENEAFADRTASDWLHASADNNDDTVAAASALLGIQAKILSRRFRHLSQGEQKLIQIASAIASQPDVLVLDEITHGLDTENRARVLQAVEAIGSHPSQPTHLVLITHHDDEIVACFRDVFEIHDQQLRRVQHQPE